MRERKCTARLSAAFGAQRKGLGLVALVLGFTTPALSEAHELTRKSAIERALDANPQIAAATSVTDEARARGEQVDAAKRPEVSLTLGVGPSLTAKLVPGTAIQSTRNAYSDFRFRDLSVVFGGTVSVIQPLYTFGKISHREDATRHETKAREHQSDMTRADVAFEVAKLYETLLFAREAKRFFDEMLHGLDRTVERTEEELAAGRLIEADLLRLQTAQGFLKLGQHQALAGLEQATSGLVAYLALPAGTTVEPKEQHLEQLQLTQEDLQQLISLARQHRPELSALQEGQAAFNALADAEEAGNWPNLFAAAFASGAYTPGRDLVDTRFAIDPLNHFFPGALVGARWQFQGGMAGARASEIRAQAAGLSHLEQWARAGIPAEVRVALEDIRRTRSDIDSTKVAVTRAKKWAIQASADFSFGLGSSTEVEDATAAYVQLRLALFRARFEHNVALASLAKATGTLVGAHGSIYPPKD